MGLNRWPASRLAESTLAPLSPVVPDQAAIHRAELSLMAAGDIPAFRTAPGGRGLFANREAVTMWPVDTAGLRIRTRLAQLTDETDTLAIEAIRASLQLGRLAVTFSAP